MIGYIFDLVLVLSIIGLTVVVLQLRQAIEATSRQIAHTLDFVIPGLPGTSSLNGEAWPEAASLQPGMAIPELADSQGRWSLALFCDASAEDLALDDQRAVEAYLGDQYRVVIASPSHNAAGEGQASSWSWIDSELLAGAPLPAVGLVSPEGTLEGLSGRTGIADMIDFAHEGASQGFGPDISGHAPAPHDHSRESQSSIHPL